VSDSTSVYVPNATLDPLAQRQQGVETWKQIERMHNRPEVTRERWNRALEMLLNGESASHIAKALRIHYGAVRAMLCDPQFRAELKEMSEEAHRRVVEQFKSVREHISQRLEEMTDLALDELEVLVANGSTEKTKLTAIDSVLDRNPLTSRHSITTPSGAGPAPAQLAVFLQIAASTARELDTKTVTATPVDAEASVSEPVS